MIGSALRPVLALSLCSLVACRDEPPSAPPPLPIAPEVVAPARPTPEQPGVTGPRPGAAAPTGKPASISKPHSRKAGKAKALVDAPLTAQATKPVRAGPARPQVAPTPAPARAPIPPPTAPVAKKVSVPRTEHVHVELPAGLQRDLDADPRMQSWVDRVIAIADGCHGNNRAARGSIEATLTMHENARPDADIRSLPGPLSGIVACATGSLMRIKMPLFTGQEGTRYDVRLVFE